LEDRNHLLVVCQATSRLQWRKECHSNILKTLTDLDTAPPLQSLLLDSLQVLLENRSLATLNVEPEATDIAEAQEAIGWHQILKGRFSQAWSETQSKYLGSRATKKKNGDTWMTKLIETILGEWLKLWKLRNEDRHGRDYNTRRQAEERQVLRELTQFYTANDGKVVARLQWLFATPLNERSEDPVGNIRIWLNAWTPVVEQSYKTDLETG
jgi:hypothetical protein